MRTLMVLGNCVAERLAGLLAGYTPLRGKWNVLPVPVIQRVQVGAETDALATRAARCDLVSASLCSATARAIPQA
ncbi:MAG: hypothetical protein LUG19_10650 [Desulfovibrio sp.]|uniref:hypothetical protein n=1 Tax=Desulfovibrio sp. TaxID=885 RepID=UPI00258878AC|nr:hypothetical protein [Desulfovibrio sp.]MCD7984688.1 hypothetical protein [Desulfovibrio sp.]